MRQFQAGLRLLLHITNPRKLHRVLQLGAILSVSRLFGCVGLAGQVVPRLFTTGL